MPSVMATRSGVFGRCVGKIDVLLEGWDSESELYYGLKYLRLILAEKAAQYLRWWWTMVPGIEGVFGGVGVIEEIKNLL